MVRICGSGAVRRPGDRTLAVHHGATCGVTTHGASLAGPDEEARAAEKMRPSAVEALPIRHADGTERWSHLD